MTFLRYQTIDFLSTVFHSYEQKNLIMDILASSQNMARLGKQNTKVAQVFHFVPRVLLMFCGLTYISYANSVLIPMPMAH